MMERHIDHLDQVGSIGQCRILDDIWHMNMNEIWKYMKWLFGWHIPLGKWIWHMNEIEWIKLPDVHWSRRPPLSVGSERCWVSGEATYGWWFQPWKIFGHFGSSSYVKYIKISQIKINNDKWSGEIVETTNLQDKFRSNWITIPWSIGLTFFLEHGWDQHKMGISRKSVAWYLTNKRDAENTRRILGKALLRNQEDHSLEIPFRSDAHKKSQLHLAWIEQSLAEHQRGSHPSCRV